MNRRIEELVKQALSEAGPNSWTDISQDRLVELLGPLQQKFAELIVEECVGILEKEIASKNETVVYNQDEWAKKNFHFTLLTNLVLETKSHFGVE